MDRVKIKETAKELLKKNHWLCVGVTLIVTLLGSINLDFSSSVDYSQVIEDIPYSYSFSSIIDSILAQSETESLPLMLLSFALGILITVFIKNQVSVGSCRFFLKYRKNQPTDVGEIFQSYRDKTFINVAKATFIRDLYIFLWSMLCFIPGIIKTYEYAAVNYILAVNPTIEYSRALDLSKRIMNGHKIELFELQISFLGWHILSLFTCGLLSIFYVNPYYTIAEAEFFAYVRELAIFNGVIAYNDIPDYEEYNPQPPTFQGFAIDGMTTYQSPESNGYAPFDPMQMNGAYIPAQPSNEPTSADIPQPIIPEPEFAPVDTPIEEIPSHEEIINEPITIDEQKSDNYPSQGDSSSESK